eukprot:364201-Chlamydomonas_euryale.AAC.22
MELEKQRKEAGSCCRSKQPPRMSRSSGRPMVSTAPFPTNYSAAAPCSRKLERRCPRATPRCRQTCTKHLVIPRSAVSSLHEIQLRAWLSLTRLQDWVVRVLREPAVLSVGRSAKNRTRTQHA